MHSTDVRELNLSPVRYKLVGQLPQITVPFESNEPLLMGETIKVNEEDLGTGDPTGNFTLMVAVLVTQRKRSVYASRFRYRYFVTLEIFP
jgi:hypothetical protein